jgi:hypothetical protein
MPAYTNPRPTRPTNERAASSTSARAAAGRPDVSTPQAPATEPRVPRDSTRAHIAEANDRAGLPPTD